MINNLDLGKRIEAPEFRIENSGAELSKLTLGDLIRIERIKQGIGITELARLINCSRTTIYRIENNEVIPKFQTIIKLAEALRADKELFIKKLEEITN